MTERAAHAVDAVFPHVPVRQWVLTLPHWLLRARVGPMDSVEPCSRSTLGPCLASSASGRNHLGRGRKRQPDRHPALRLGVESERPLSHARALRRVHRPVIVTCAPPQRQRPLVTYEGKCHRVEDGGINLLPIQRPMRHLGGGDVPRGTARGRLDAEL
jgi:hypothetical protein